MSKIDSSACLTMSQCVRIHEIITMTRDFVDKFSIFKDKDGRGSTTG